MSLKNINEKNRKRRFDLFMIGYKHAQTGQDKRTYDHLSAPDKHHYLQGYSTGEDVLRQVFEQVSREYEQKIGYEDYMKCKILLKTTPVCST